MVIDEEEQIGWGEGYVRCETNAAGSQLRFFVIICLFQMSCSK